MGARPHRANEKHRSNTKRKVSYRHDSTRIFGVRDTDIRTGVRSQMPTNIVTHYRRTYHLYQILEVKTTKLLELLRPKTTLEGGRATSARKR